MENVSILERLENAASNGKFFMELCLWKRTITSLKKKGIKVIVLNQLEPSKYVCKVTWEDAKPENPDPKTYSISNNLYLIARDSTI